MHVCLLIYIQTHMNSLLHNWPPTYVSAYKHTCFQYFLISGVSVLHGNSTDMEIKKCRNSGSIEIQKFREY